jgi:hypothetical protein
MNLVIKEGTNEALKELALRPPKYSILRGRSLQALSPSMSPDHFSPSFHNPYLHAGRVLHFFLFAQPLEISLAS